MYKKLITTILTLSVFIANEITHAEDKIQQQNISLTVAVPQKIVFGENFSFEIILNSKVKQSLCSIETSKLQILVENIDDKAKIYYHYSGSTRIIRNEMFEYTCTVKREYIEMKENEQATCKMDVINDVNMYLPQGNYSVMVIYEGKIQAKNKFSIVLDYKKTVSKLIDQITKSNKWGQEWNISSLCSIIGRPVWESLPTGSKAGIKKDKVAREWWQQLADSKERIAKKNKAFRKWWQDNKQTILLVEKRTKEAERILHSHDKWLYLETIVNDLCDNNKVELIANLENSLKSKEAKKYIWKAAMHYKGKKLAELLKKWALANPHEIELMPYQPNGLALLQAIALDKKQTGVQRALSIRKLGEMGNTSAAKTLRKLLNDNTLVSKSSEENPIYLRNIARKWVSYLENTIKNQFDLEN